MSKHNVITYFTSVYCVLVVIQNLFEMKTIGTSTFAIVGGGIIVSWITFLITDIITEVFGEEKNTKMFTFAGILNAIIVIIAQIVIILPGTYEQQNEAFRLIFSNGVRTMIASLVAFYVGNYINMIVMIDMKKSSDEGNFAFFLRCVLSTLLGQFADNIIFVAVAFAPIGLSAFEMTTKDIVTSVAIGTTIETLVESIFVPLVTIPLSNKLKEKFDIK